MTFKTLITAALAATTLAGAAFAESHAATGNPMVGGAAMFPEMNIVENAVTCGRGTCHLEDMTLPAALVHNVVGCSEI